MPTPIRATTPATIHFVPLFNRANGSPEKPTEATARKTSDSTSPGQCRPRPRAGVAGSAMLGHLRISGSDMHIQHDGPGVAVAGAAHRLRRAPSLGVRAQAIDLAGIGRARHVVVRP